MQGSKFKLYTGPYARNVVERHLQGELEARRVFVLYKVEEDVQLKENVKVLCQASLHPILITMSYVAILQVI